MTDRDSRESIKTPHSFRNRNLRLALAGGFALVSGIAIMPSGVVSAPAPVERFHDPKPTETPVPRNTPTRVPTANVLATQLHEARVTLSVMNSEITQLRVAVTQQAADISTMTAKNRDIVVEQKGDESFLNLIKIGLIGAGGLWAARFGWRVYDKKRKAAAAAHAAGGGGHAGGH